MKPLTRLSLLLSVLLAACSRFSATSTPAAQPTPDEPSVQLKTFEALWQDVNDNLVYEDFGGVDWDAVGDEYRAKVTPGLSGEEFSELMGAMLAELPPGLARYESRVERIAVDTADTSNYQGIGAFVTFRAEPEPHVVLMAVIEGSPAQAAGLRDHDSIYAVDGEPMTAEEGLAVVNRIRGPAGTTVTLSVQSHGGSRRDVTVSRGQIVAAVDPLIGTLPGTSIGYMRVPPSAGEDLAQWVVQAMGVWSQAGPVSGVILDLRIAGSGGNWPLGEMLSMFGDGPVGEFYTRTDSQPQQVAGADVQGSQTVPLVLLIGPDTQGVPEIFAAVLHSMGRATLVGLPTPGEIELPTEFPLPDGSRAFVATSSFRTTDGDELGLDGLTPDVRVDADWDQVTDVNDPVVAAAVIELTR